MICKACNSTVLEGKFCNYCGSALVPICKTLSDVYLEWSDFYYRRIGHDTRNNYRAGWKHLEPLHDEAFHTLRTMDFQNIIDIVSEFQSTSSLRKIKQVVHHLYNYAIMMDITASPTNYAQFLFIESQPQQEKPIFFDADILRIIDYAKDKRNCYWETARIVSTLIFTGFRPSELFHVRKEDVDLQHNFIVGGSKTPAGINRLVPITKIIRPFITEWYLSRKQSTIQEPSYLLRSPKGKQMRLEHWRDRRFYPLMIELGINSIELSPYLKPHCCRHTFASLCYRARVRPEILLKIMGHTDFEFTNQVYIHNGADEYHHEINKVSDLISIMEIKEERKC